MCIYIYIHEQNEKMLFGGLKKKSNVVPSNLKHLVSCKHAPSEKKTCGSAVEAQLVGDHQLWIGSCMSSVLF